MQEPTRIIAVRHGETAWNVDTRIQGHLDIPLNATGRRQAHLLAAALQPEAVRHIYSSDLGRAWETAHTVHRATGAALHAQPALRERRFGVFEGRTFTEIETELPHEALRWRRRDPEFAPAGGESLRDFRQRVLDAAHALAAQHMGEHIVLVAHGGVLDVLYRDAAGLELHAPRTWMTSNAAINRLLWTPSGGMTLVGWGDTGHLEAGARDESEP